MVVPRVYIKTSPFSLIIIRDVICESLLFTGFTLEKAVETFGPSMASPTSSSMFVGDVGVVEGGISSNNPFTCAKEYSLLPGFGIDLLDE